MSKPIQLKNPAAQTALHAPPLAKPIPSWWILRRLFAWDVQPTRQLVHPERITKPPARLRKTRASAFFTL